MAAGKQRGHTSSIHGKQKEGKVEAGTESRKWGQTINPQSPPQGWTSSSKVLSSKGSGGAEAVVPGEKPLNWGQEEEPCAQTCKSYMTETQLKCVSAISPFPYRHII